MREIRDPETPPADHGGQSGHLVVRPLQQRVEQAQLVEQIERRGMNRVAPEIAQEIAMLLQHARTYPGAGEEIPPPHPRRSAAGDDDLEIAHHLSSPTLAATPA